jgi:hypothetical protein
MAAHFPTQISPRWSIGEAGEPEADTPEARCGPISEVQPGARLLHSRPCRASCATCVVRGLVTGSPWDIDFDLSETSRMPGSAGRRKGS